MIKTCNNCSLNCVYASMSTAGYLCSFEGYCDYQTPKDSRVYATGNPASFNINFDQNKETDGN